MALRATRRSGKHGKHGNAAHRQCNGLAAVVDPSHDVWPINAVNEPYQSRWSPRLHRKSLTQTPTPTGVSRRRPSPMRGQRGQEKYINFHPEPYHMADRLRDKDATPQPVDIGRLLC